jgi:hypothetical protein
MTIPDEDRYTVTAELPPEEHRPVLPQAINTQQTSVKPLPLLGEFVAVVQPRSVRYVWNRRGRGVACGM